MTVAELVILGAAFGLLLWGFRPLQRGVRNRIERWLLSGKHGKVIEGRFRTISRDDPPDGKPAEDHSADGNPPDNKKD